MTDDKHVMPDYRKGGVIGRIVQKETVRAYQLGKRDALARVVKILSQELDEVTRGNHREHDAE